MQLKIIEECSGAFWNSSKENNAMIVKMGMVKRGCNDEVNMMIEKAVKAGGKEPNEAKDYGFMQQRSFEDLDGHLWEMLYIDLTKFPKR